MLIRIRQKPGKKRRIQTPESPPRPPPGDLTREMIRKAIEDDPSGRALANLLYLHGRIAKPRPTVEETFEPLPDLF